MKRVFKFLFVLVIAAAFLQGCSGSESSVETSPPTEDNVETSEELTGYSSDDLTIEHHQVNISSFDGYNLQGRVSMPQGVEDVSRLVIYS